MSGLPSTWCDTKFTEVFDVQGGTQPPKSTFIDMPMDGYIRLLQIRDFGAKPVPTYIPEKKTLKTCEKNDLLIARYGASLGRICTGMEGAYNVALAKLVCPEQIDKAFAKYYLRSDQFQSPLRLLSRSAQNGFNKEDLADFDLSFPPLAEQTRIAQKLDELLAQVDTLKARLDAIPALLKRFRQSVLAAVVSGRLTEEWRLARMKSGEVDAPNAINFKKLSDICLSITDGDHQAPPQSDTGIPFITISAINDGVIRLEKATRYVPDSYYSELKESRKPQIGDILFSVTGSICIPAMVLNEAPFTFQRHIAILRPNTALVLQRFMYFYLGSEQIKKQGLDVATGTAQLTVPLKGLRNFDISLPSLEEQTEIVRRVEQLFAFADQLEAKVTSAKSRIDHLTQSILAKAFRGELVPQDPNDEPASQLLARIQAQRAAAPKTKRGRKSA
jgi:type I restriction enzyme S subunit